MGTTIVTIIMDIVMGIKIVIKIFFSRFKKKALLKNQEGFLVPVILNPLIVLRNTNFTLSWGK